MPALDMSHVNKDNAEEVGWAVVECLAEALSMDDACKLVLVVFKEKSASLKRDLDQGMVKNPYWDQLGLSSHGSRKTKAYLDARVKKNFVASLFKWGGSAASVVTAVDLGTSSLGTQSVALTGVHAYKLVGLRNKYANRDFRGYIDLCLEAKAVKATSRAGETVIALIPGACIAAKVGVAAANAVFKLGAKVTLSKAIDRTAQLLHMHAYLESTDAGPKPATEVWNEVFTKRGATQIFGQYDVAALIREQSGWMALADKLKLI